ncbi:MAG: DNA repair exonuclease [Saprospiraceae bacterium]|nr:DNA repair exonuclease [Saprospiraceae bacterium]MBP7699209.1 DNA repair exonuclease [Saprospiraceae bacterium]
MIVHFSDTHLGYSNYNYVDDAGINIREQDFYRAFTQVIDGIIALQPQFVLHSGDFFHRPSPTNRAVTVAVEQLTRLAEKNIPLVIISGNHSTPKTIYTSPILKIFSSLKNTYPIYNQQYETLQFDDIVIHGLPHINDTTIQHQELKKIKVIGSKKNILLLHTSLGKQFLMDEYGEQVFPSEYVSALPQFDYVALGHWHNFQQVKGFPNAWYSGSTERMSDSEIGVAKGYCTLTVSDTPISPTFVTIPTRTWYKWTIKKCHEKSTEEILAAVEKLVSENNTKDAIIHLNLEAISAGQSLEFTNFNLKKYFADALHCNIRRTTHYEDKFFNKYDKDNFTRLDQIFEEFVQKKYTDPTLANKIIQRAKPYFSEFEE